MILADGRSVANDRIWWTAGQQRSQRPGTPMRKSGPAYIFIFLPITGQLANGHLRELFRLSRALCCGSIGEILILKVAYIPELHSNRATP